MTELELDLLCDERGFLIDSHLWVAEIAEALAAKEGIHLTPAHWEVLNLL
ncbi:TusE/DsrC/DsvC family sulfur relay protein, partial [Luminiphilus sp.]|nr:TusE/DsrC/DsvC family sulfur relay protein [Luminiphilus sp.]